MPDTKGFTTADLLSACLSAVDNLDTAEAIRRQDWMDRVMPAWIQFRDHITRCHRENRPVTRRSMDKIVGTRMFQDRLYDGTARTIAMRVWSPGRRGTEHVYVSREEILGLQRALEAWESDTITLAQVRQMGFTHTVSAVFLAAERDSADDETRRPFPPLVRYPY